MLFTTRKSEEKDAMQIYKFICTLEEVDFDFVVFRNIYLNNLANSEYIYLIAETENEVIGFISCHTQNLLHHCGRVAEIQELYVSKNFRNIGIGSVLVSEVEKKAIEAGCISLEVTAQNKRMQTHEFYTQVGFDSSHKKFVKKLQSF